MATGLKVKNAQSTLDNLTRAFKQPFSAMVAATLKNKEGPPLLAPAATGGPCLDLGHETTAPLLGAAETQRAGTHVDPRAPRAGIHVTTRARRAGLRESA